MENSVHRYSRTYAPRYCVTRQCTPRRVHKATTPRLLVEPCQVFTYKRQNEVSNTYIWKFNIDLEFILMWRLFHRAEYRVKLSLHGKVWQDLPCYWTDLSAPRLHSNIASDSGIPTLYKREILRWPSNMCTIHHR